MKLLKLYTDNFSTYVNQQKDKVELEINEIVRSNQNSFFDKVLNGQKLHFSNDTLEITLRGAFFNPYGARGNIKITFAANETNNKTKIECHLNSIDRRTYPVLIILLSIWTLISLLISTNANILLTIICGWTAFLSFTHFWCKWKLVQLKKYAQTFIKTKIVD
jgi:hypothetical protein